MIRLIAAAAAIFLVASCASPLDERWSHDEQALPAWITEGGSLLVAERGETPRRAEAASIDSLDALIAWAMERHPALQAAEARWHAALNRITPARTLPEPQASYRVAVEQIERDREPLGHTVGITQAFPWFGTLELSGEMRSSEARAAAEAYRRTQWEVSQAIKEAWADYAYLHGAAAILREQIALLDQLENVVRARYRTAQVDQRELVRLQIERDALENELLDTIDMVSAVKGRLNAAAGRSANAALPEDPMLPVPEVDLLEDRLAAILHVSNPSLGAMRHELAARRQAIQLAEKRFHPEFMLGIEYGVNTSKRMAGMDGGGDDMLGAMIGLTLPVWTDSYEAGVSEAMAEWGAVLRGIADEGNRLQSELKMALYNIRDARRRIDLFGTRLRVRAEQVLHTTEAAYRTGTAGFSDLIEAQREALEYALGGVRAEADLFRAIARLEAMIGQALPSEPSDASTSSSESETSS